MLPRANPPPHLNSSMYPFEEHLKASIEADLKRGSASLYFRAYGQADGVIPPAKWRDVKWTIDDFNYFYDCPEFEEAMWDFMEECVVDFPLFEFPSWEYVVDAMQYLFLVPEYIVDFMNIKPEVEIDKTAWLPIDHTVGFILRLLNYREHIHIDAVGEGEYSDRSNEFLAEQKNYSKLSGSVDPFYGIWDGSDKWTAAFLLYLKLKYIYEGWVKEVVEGDPQDLVSMVEEYQAIEGENSALHPEAKDRYDKLKATGEYD
ncbi:hypothetical protein F5Y11DRAFT_346304 [Daldinia sp. FL1419]|nr:hypothetical protein F5Y11DRAFT_346304 [Daldinia sp. FL1419]